MSAPLIRVELHCHTYRSKDCLMRVDRLIATARRKGLQRLAITDHNQIEGAFEAHALDPELVIVGEEIFTTRGELLGYYMSELIPPGLEPLETIERMKAQGAVISVPHPLDSVRGGAWEEADLRAILPHVDAIEIFNARCIGGAANRRAADLARQMGLPGTAGSDAHSYLEVGTAGLRLPAFDDAPSMRQSLRQSEVIGRLSSPLVHFLSRYASLRKKLARG
jgi:hypothetical protein